MDLHDWHDIEVESDPTIRVVIAGPHRLVLELLARWLAPYGIETVGTAESAADQSALALDLLPDIVLSEFLPDDNFPHSVRIALLTGSVNPVSVRNLLRRVPAVFSLLGLDLALLAQSIRRVVEGNEVGYFGSADDPEDFSEVGSNLSAHERLLLQRVVSGKSVGEIAKEFTIASKTVNNQLAAVSRKLGVDTTVQAVIKAIRLGIVKLDENT